MITLSLISFCGFHCLPKLSLKFNASNSLTKEAEFLVLFYAYMMAFTPQIKEEFQLQCLFPKLFGF